MIQSHRINDKTLELFVKGEMTETAILSENIDLKAFLKQGEDLRLLLHLENVSYKNFKALMADLKAGMKDLKQLGNLDRIALVSNQEWLKIGSKIDSAFIPDLVIKSFDLDEKEAALLWLEAESIEKIPQTNSPAKIELKNNENGTYTLVMSGRITKQSTEDALSQLRPFLKSHSNIRLLADLTHYEGFDFNTLFADDLFDLKEDATKSLEKYAILGAPAWAGGLATSMGKFLKTDIKTFKAGEQNAAMAWLTAN